MCTAPLFAYLVSGITVRLCRPRPPSTIGSQPSSRLPVEGDRPTIGRRVGGPLGQSGPVRRSSGGPSSTTSPAVLRRDREGRTPDAAAGSRRLTPLSGGSLTLEPPAQLVEHAAGAVLAQLRVVEAVEKGAMLRVGQLGAGAAVGRVELDRREGHRHERAAKGQVVGERNPLVGDDVVVAGLIPR